MLISHQRLIQISTIDDRANWSLNPFDSDTRLNHLRESIQKVGLLHPPIVVLTDNDNYKIVNGWKRVQIATELNLNPLLCHTVNPALPAWQLLTIHLTEQQFSAPLSTMEKAYFFQLCLQYISEKEISEIFLPLLGHPPQIMIINKTLSFLQLEDRLQLLFHNGFVNEKTAAALLKLGRGDRLILTDLFIKLNVGHGKQHRLLTLCHEISHKLNKPIRSILSDTAVQKIIDHQKMNIPQKMHQLLDFLQKQHSPLFTKAKEQFNKRKNQLNLPENCSLEHSPSFEKDQVTLSITYTDMEKCEKNWETIHELIKK